MIMSTIQENLQTIANSTAAIKQAIIDKGGEITGDITTWASAINGISGGGNAGEGNENHSKINTVYVGKKPVSTGVPKLPGATYVAAHCFFQKPLDSTIQINAMVSTGDGAGTATVNCNAGDISVITTGVQDDSTFCVDVYKHFIRYGEIIGNSNYIYDVKYLESKYITFSCTETGPDEYRVVLTANFKVPSNFYIRIDDETYELSLLGDKYVLTLPMYTRLLTIDDIIPSPLYDDKYYYVVTSNN